MIQKLIYRLFFRRHFWRHASFSEVAELYASRSMTMFALRFVAVFISVYLFQLGYSLTVIALFWTVFYGLKALWAYPAALILASQGPKHGLLYANVLFAFGMLALFNIEHYGFGMLIIWCVIHSFAGTLNNLCYMVDFSKVKHSDHAGKELGYMSIIEKIAAGLSPVIGGVLASVFSPLAAIFLSATLFLLSAVPLMQTKEPIKTHQKLRFHGYPWRLTRSNYIAQAAVGVDIFASASAWSLFIAMIVFANDGQEIYAKIGALASFTVLVALVSSFAYGRLIDRQAGGQLLSFAVLANSLTHILRPSVNSVFGVIGNNIANEATTTGYNMAFTRGIFDTADRSGFRVTYLFLLEIAANSGAALAALYLALLSMISIDNQLIFALYFVPVGFFTLLIMTPGFKLYRNTR